MRGKEKTEVRARLEESPVEGLTLAPFSGRPFMSRFVDADKVGELERRVTELRARPRTGAETRFR